jgi:hypothetical protein
MFPFFLTLFVFCFSTTCFAAPTCSNIFKPSPQEYYEAAVFPGDPEWLVALFDRRIQEQEFKLSPNDESVIRWLQQIARLNQEYPIASLTQDRGLIEISKDVWDRFIKEGFDAILIRLEDVEIERINLSPTRSTVSKTKIPFLLEASEDTSTGVYTLEVERSLIEFMLKMEEPTYYSQAIEKGWYRVSRRYIRPPNNPY